MKNDSKRGKERSAVARVTVVVAVLALLSPPLGSSAKGEPERGALAVDVTDPVAGWHGIASASRSAAIGSEEAGVLVEVLVEEGQPVRQGQVLARLDAGVPRAQVERLELIAGGDLRIREAEQRLHVAEQEEKRVSDLGNQEIASAAQLQRARLDRIVATLAVEAAKLEQRVAAAQLAEARARLARFELRAPFDGAVANLAHQVGDAVERLRPVVQIVATDPLWVQFDCSLTEAAALRVGTKVDVAQRTDEAKRRIGTVIYRSVLANPASQTRMVRVAVANAEHDWVAGSAVRIWPRLDRVPAKPK